MFGVKKILMFELILGKCQKDPDPEGNPVYKIQIFWIRIRPKMDRIRNPAYLCRYLYVW